MVTDKIRLLLVEDNAADARLIQELLGDSKTARFEVTRAASLEEARARGKAARFDVALLDLTLPDSRGLDTFHRFHSQNPALPVVIMTGLDEEGFGVDAVKSGAQDYLVKGESATQGLVRTLRHAIERREIEAALRLSIDEFRALSEAVPQIVWITRADGWCLFFNRQWTDYTGLTLEESVGDEWIKPFHPEDRQVAWDAWKKATTKNAPYDLESRLRRADGEYRWWLIHGVPLLDDSGAIIKWYGTCTDIHELKTAELNVVRANRVLAESEENYRQLFNAVADPLVIIDSGSGLIVDVNEVALRLYGYSREELLGNSARMLSAEPDKSDDALERVQNADDTEVLLRTHRGKNGETFPTEIRISTFIRGDRRLLIAAIRDISERVATQRQIVESENKLRQAQKMEAMGRLAGGVAHDFNNILTAILGLADIAIAALPKDHPVREDIMEVRSAGFRAAGLTKQLLAFSRRQVTSPRVMDLDATVAGLAKMLARIIGEHIKLVIEPGLAGRHIKADPGQIEQLVLNLAVNARDAMPGGGTITIKTATEMVGREAAQRDGLFDGPHAVLTVSDTGTGMSDEVKSHLFEPFYTTKEKGKGTGLGLSTCYGVVKQNGGSIQCVSAVGAGTSFRMLFPHTTGALAPAARANGAPAPKGGETILVVEDEEPVRRLCARILRGLGYAVLEAADGAEGLAHVRGDAKREIRLVLTDMVMPKTSGWDLSRQVAEIREDIPVLFVSGYTEDTFENLCLLNGPADILTKPYTAEALAVSVRAAIDRGRA